CFLLPAVALNSGVWLSCLSAGLSRSAAGRGAAHDTCCCGMLSCQAEAASRTSTLTTAEQLWSGVPRLSMDWATCVAKHRGLRTRECSLAVVDNAALLQADMHVKAQYAKRVDMCRQRQRW
ncbi:hypothetical protein COO60DRAFT_1512583, partial [Scenedesmus sp. NREL 46B-D3]